MFLLAAPVLALVGQPDLKTAPFPVPPPFVQLAPPGPPLPPATPTAVDLTPKAGGSAAAGLPCPGPTVHPFQRLPRICPAIPCECDGAAGKGGAADTPSWVKVFHDAAHFPLPRFAADGTPICHDGLLIYEGMRLTAYSTGAYEVSFTTTVPDMPVTIRLQFVLQHAAGGREYRITLPPIRLEPRTDVRPGDPAANTFHVAHRGHSDVLTAAPPDAGVAPPWAIPGAVLAPPAGTRTPYVARVGTARFGTPIAATDPFR